SRLPADLGSLTLHLFSAFLVARITMRALVRTACLVVLASILAPGCGDNRRLGGVDSGTPPPPPPPPPDSGSGCVGTSCLMDSGPPPPPPDAAGGCVAQPEANPSACTDLIDNDCDLTIDCN